MVLKALTTKDFMDLDPSKIWLIKTETAQQSAEMAEVLTQFNEQNPGSNIRGIIMPHNDIAFEEVSTEWIIGYIRSLQDLLKEREQHEATSKGTH